MGDILLLTILIVFSAYFSASEFAFIAANKIKVEIKARRKNLAAESALFFTNNPQDFFSTILIGNNIVNIAFASLSTVIFSTLFGMGEFSILILSTLIILFFGELFPKYLASEISDRFVLITSIPLRLCYFVLYPFVKLTGSVSSILTQSSNVKSESMNYLFSKEDLQTLVKESHEAGMVNKKESDIISKVLELGEQRVYEAMRPRTEIVGIEIDSTIDEAIDIFIESGYSKIPVYEENLDNIKGVVYAYDMFKSPSNLQSITREMIFVPETKRSFEMLNEFLSKQVSIAVVIDEFGGTAGIVTVEDIIEELFGEIKDEYDIEENICRKISEGSYIISGKVEVDYINEKYNLKIPEGDYETLAGYIINALGRIPEQGETVIIDKYNMLIARATNKVIDVVKLMEIAPVD